MTSRSGRQVLLLISLIAVALVVFVACGDDDDDSGSDGGGSGDIVLSDVWARPAMLLDDDMEHDSDGTAEEGETDEESDMGMGGTNGAAYMTIENTSEEDDRLVSASTDVAATVEIHTVTMTDGVMQMRQLDEGLEVPAGENVVLEPGGYHIMMIDLQDSLEVGDTFDIELEFENAGMMTVNVEVREP